MTEMVKFSGELRESTGTGAARALRNAGMIPAVIYGGNEAAQSIAIGLKEFNKEYQKGSIKTKLIELNINGKSMLALPKVIDLHPVTDLPDHIDFLRVDKDTTVRVLVNVKVTNEDKSIGVKKGGIVNIVHRSILFECHPGKIPNHIEVDVGSLDIGHNVHINDIKLPEGVKPVDSTNFTVVSVMGRASEDESKSAASAEAAAPAASAPAAAKPAAKK